MRNVGQSFYFLSCMHASVPAVPSSCNITLSYDSHSSGKLQFINTSWDTVLVSQRNISQSQKCNVDWNLSLKNSVDPGEACPSTRGDVTQYQISFQTASVVATEIVNITRCNAGRCRHTFQPSSNPPSSYDNVSVAAENVVGVGTARLCTTQTISKLYNLYSSAVPQTLAKNFLHDLLLHTTQ